MLVQISAQQPGGRQPARGPDPLVAVDVLLGLARPARRLVTRTTHIVSTVAAPPLRLALHPPGVPATLHPARWIDALARSGADRRELLAVQASGRADVLVPVVVDTVLDRLDLTAVVLERVDLDAVVTAVLAQVDLIAIAEEVIDGVDLPEIIRESTGSMASDTVRGARMQGISADEAVGRAVDRLLLRHGRRAVRPPESADATTDATHPVTERAP